MNNREKRRQRNIRKSTKALKNLTKKNTRKKKDLAEKQKIVAKYPGTYIDTINDEGNIKYVVKERK